MHNCSKLFVSKFSNPAMSSIPIDGPAICLQQTSIHCHIKGPFKSYVTQMGGGQLMGGDKFSGKKRYKGIKVNVISVTRWVRVKFPEKIALRNT